MRLRKIHICILEFILSISLMCVGFANWTINSNAIDKANGEFGTYNVIESSDYIELTSNSYSLNYGKKGFINENKEYIKNPNLITTFKINLNNIRNSFNNINDVWLNINLSYSNCEFIDGQGLFNTYSITDSEYSEENNYTTEDIIPQFVFNFNVKFLYNDVEQILNNENIIIQDNKLTIKLKLVDYITDISSVNECLLTFKCLWIIEDIINYFENNIYPIIYKNNANQLQFDVSASIYS